MHRFFAKTQLMILLLSLFIVILALVTRLYHLPSLPAGFHNDEASFFYNAMMIRQTGMDEDGRGYPLFLNSFIDPKPALISYLQIPFISLLGTSIWAARLPTALLGIASLGILYLLLQQLKVSEEQSVLITLLMTLSPWHIIVSRSTQEVIAAFFFGLASLYVLTRLIDSMQSTSKWLTKVLYLSVFAITAALTMYSYHSAKVVLPLLIVAVLWVMQSWKKTILLPVLVIVLTTVLTLGVTFMASAGLARFNELNVFTKGDAFLLMDEQIKTATPHEARLLIRAYHNKIINALFSMGGIYTQHLTIDFLFLSGGEPNRYVVPFHGLFYLIELPLLLVGIVLAFQQKNTLRQRQLAVFFTIWLCVAPLPAAITTQEVPSTIRSFWMIVPLLYFISVTLERTLQHIRSEHKSLIVRLSIWLLGLIVLIGYGWGIGYFIHQFSIFQTYYHPWHRNYADTTMAEAVAGRQSDFETIRVGRFTGQPYVYLALEGLIAPQLLQTSYPLRSLPEYSLGKYYFSPDSCPIEPRKNVLFVIRENCVIPQTYRVLEKTTYQDGNDGYSLVIYDPPVVAKTK